jgi:8-amino-7-oxononanoate synthase
MSIEKQLEELTNAGLERSVVDTVPVGAGRLLFDGAECLDFSSNDYLGMAGDRELVERLCEAARETGVGSGAARLLSGSRPLASRFETKFAELMGKEDALLFNSGYHANSGLIGAITTGDSVVFSDQHNHASIVDGCRLSRASIVVYKHADMDHLESLLSTMTDDGILDPTATNVLVTEGLFSMDGDSPDLPRLLHLKRGYGLLLYVDDAHGFGILGKTGRGAFEDILPDVDIMLACFGKAVGVFGAAAAADASVLRLARSRARPFVFSTSLPPAIVATVDLALYLLSGRKGSRLRKKLHRRATLFRNLLAEGGLAIGPGESHIVPVLLGDEVAALGASVSLLEAGIFCRAIRYPTVPMGSARLRFSVTALHREKDLRWAAARIIQVCKSLEVKI